LYYANTCKRAQRAREYSAVARSPVDLFEGARRMCRGRRHRSRMQTGTQGARVQYYDLLLLFITAVPITKLFAWGEGNSGGHVL